MLRSCYSRRLSKEVRLKPLPNEYTYSTLFSLREMVRIRRVPELRTEVTPISKVRIAIILPAL